MNKSPKIGFVSLGCPKNLVDSERILTQLRIEGYQLSPQYDDADLVVVNTCGFIDSAVEESLDVIGEALQENGRVIVTGCLGAKQENITDVHPSVLAVTGPHAYEEVMSLVHEHSPAPSDADLSLGKSLLPASGLKLTPKHYAYLKISEGCNHSCSFCIIPDMRGKLVSRPIGEVMNEAENLVETGVRELLIVSQDTSAYGVDIKYRPDFINGRPVATRIQTLAKELSQLPAWVRLHYVYPYPHVDDLIEHMGGDSALLPYLDMPLQHGSEKILRLMKRPAATEKVLDRIHRWRQQLPELTLRSTFIVGFPGETDQDFDELLAFIKEAQLDRVGAFAYSNVEGAQSNALPDHVPEALKQERLKAFMEVQSEISAEKLQNKINQKMIVLVDEVHEDHFVARSSADAPEIDGNVLVSGGWDVDPGDFIEVVVTGADQHDLFAEVVE
jgi:ribosomal protein S12 methylthiotransferase